MGGGLAARFRGIPGSVWVPIIPTLKVLSDPKEKQESEYFDNYAGSIIGGTESIEQAGYRFLEEVINIASGKLAKLEIAPAYREIMEIYSTLPTL